MESTNIGSTDWQVLPETMQAMLARQALHRATLIIAEQAELFAVQFQGGALADRGAADALRLFAALLRETAPRDMTPVGRA